MTRKCLAIPTSRTLDQPLTLWLLDHEEFQGQCRRWTGVARGSAQSLSPCQPTKSYRLLTSKFAIMRETSGNSVCH